MRTRQVRNNSSGISYEYCDKFNKVVLFYEILQTYENSCQGMENMHINIGQQFQRDLTTNFVWHFKLACSY